MFAVVGLAALDKLHATWALVAVGVFAMVAVLDEASARRPVTAVAWVAAVGAGVVMYLAVGRWWGVVAAVVALVLVTPFANRETL